MSYALIAIALITLASGCWAGFLALAATLGIFLLNSGAQTSGAQYTVLMGLSLAAPLAGFTSVKILERCCGRYGELKSLSALAVMLPMLPLLSDGQILEYAEIALIALGSTTVNAVLLLGATINAAFLCAAISSVALIGCVVVVETPLRWLSRASSARLSISYDSMRLLILILLASLSFQLIAGLFVSELSPLKIFSVIK